NAAAQIENALRGCFYGEIVTHEQKLKVLSLREWENILKSVNRLTSKTEKIFSTHDETALYLRKKRHNYIIKSTVNGKNINFTMKRKIKSHLKISVFKEEDGQITREFV
ncbi:MAG: hypothetical protein PHV82_12935, partial [Victivallaceae bacterium]|nr:hypothetical protein [Victivallaceae bacterium]